MESAIPDVERRLVRVPHFREHVLVSNFAGSAAEDAHTMTLFFPHDGMLNIWQFKALPSLLSNERNLRHLPVEELVANPDLRFQTAHSCRQRLYVEVYEACEVGPAKRSRPLSAIRAFLLPCVHHFSTMCCDAFATAACA